MNKHRSVIIAAAVAVLLVLTALVLPSYAAVSAPAPERLAAYYQWYPDNWGTGNAYTSAYGAFSSDNQAIMAADMAAFKQAGLTGVFVSWWGRGQKGEATRLPKLLDVAAAAGMHVTVYYEPEGQSTRPTPDQLKADLAYLHALADTHPAWLRRDGAPLIMVYNASTQSSTCAQTQRWADATAGTDWLANLKVFGGYQSCTPQPFAWHQYAPDQRYVTHAGVAGQSEGSSEVSAGFDKYNEAPRLLRDDQAWCEALTSQVLSGLPWQLSYGNEFREGTQIVPTVQRMSASGWGVDLDIMRQVYVQGRRCVAGSPSPSGTPTPSPTTPMPSPTPSPSPTGTPSPTPTPTPTPSPTPPAGLPTDIAHIVVVVEENHTDTALLTGPWLHSLADGGALFSASVGTRHPSLPNYLDLFSGQYYVPGTTTQIGDDSCNYAYPDSTANLASQLLGAGRTWGSIAEGYPLGSTACTTGGNAKKHMPWLYWPGLPISTQLPLSALAGDFAALPNVTFVIPNLCHDMHDCSVAVGDAWLNTNLTAYRNWAADPANHALLVVTTDEDDGSLGNQIYTVAYGAAVHPGTYPETMTHEVMLRTIEALYGLPGINNAAAKAPVSDVWNPSST